MPSNSILNIKKDGEWVEIPALKGEDGFSPTATVKKVGKVATITITDINGTTSATIADGTGSGGSGEKNTIESISVNGTPISIDENKNVDITVPKVTNDLTDELKSSYDDAVTAKHTHNNKTVLDGITAEKVESWDKAEENIQSDWNETDDTADGFIKNKPTIPSLDGYAKTSEIPSKVSELTNDSNYQTAEQVSSTVTTEIAKIVADAPEDFDTLKEMSDWIAGHEDDASAMNSAISDNKTAITALQTGKADKSEIPTTVAELTDSTDYAKTSDVNASISTLQTDKANASDLTAHTDDADIHVTAENKTLWNTVSNKVNKEDGKALLADTDKTNYDDAVTKAHTHENKEVLDGITSDKVTTWDTVNNKVDKVDGKGLSTNDYTTTEKNKLAGIAEGANKTIVDSVLDTSSENPVQNKVIAGEINTLKKSVSDGKTTVANAITDKGVTTATDATFATMANNISQIETGVDTSDATATADQILTGQTAYVNGVKVTGTMANLGAVSQALNAGGSYTIPDGYHNGNGIITANSLSSQTSATATAAHILSGQTAWVNGSKLTGTMTNNGAKSTTLNCGGSYTIPVGYHNGSGKITANSLASQTSATATAADIASGKTAWVNGSMLTGTMSGGYKYASGTVSSPNVSGTGSVALASTGLGNITVMQIIAIYTHAPVTDNQYNLPMFNIDDIYSISGTTLLSQTTYCDSYYNNGVHYMAPSSNFYVTLSHSNGMIYANVASLNSRRLTISLASSMKWIIFYT